MSTIIENEFTQYELTRQELLTGSVLTTTQKQFIQSQIAMIAQSRLSLVPDPNNYSSFIQTESHYKGQMDALKYLLDCSDSSELELLALAQAQNATS